MSVQKSSHESPELEISKSGVVVLASLITSAMDNVKVVRLRLKDCLSGSFSVSNLSLSRLTLAEAF